MDDQPPSKRRKLDLSEVPALLEDYEKKEGKPDDVKGDSQGMPASQQGINSSINTIPSSIDFSHEERVEETQIQASLPVYLDHIFGTHIGQSQVMRILNTQERAGPHCMISQAVSSQLLDSQGFVRQRSLKVSPIRLCSSTEHFIQQSPVREPIPSIIPAGKASTPVRSPDSTNEGCSSPVLFHSPLTSSPLSKEPDRGTINQSSCAKVEQCGVNKPTSDVKKNQCESATSIDVSKDSGHVTVTRKRDLSRVHLTGRDTKGYICPLTCTPLTECTQAHKSVSVFAMILQVNPVMEVACKTGHKAGSTVPMSSVLLGDPTKSYFKLSLWREAAAWVERFTAGDIVLFKNIKLKTWLKEIVGTTVMHSSVLNLHQPKKPLPNKVTNIVSLEQSLDGLMEWARKYHGYLVGGASAIPKSQRVVNFLTSDEFGTESLIHFRAKLLTVISSRVLLVADEPGKEVHLHLLSVETALWSTQLTNGGVGQVWEFMFVAVYTEGGTQGGAYSLQTTSRSQLRSVKEDCEIAHSIFKKFSSDNTRHSFVVRDCTISDVVTRKASGLFELKAKAISVEFFFWDRSNLSLSSLVQLEPTEMVAQLCQAVYVGCESCSQPLKQDHSGIYHQCKSCMMKKPGGYPNSSYYFSPVVCVLQDSSGSVNIIATYLILPKVLGMTALDVVKASLSHDDVKCLKLKSDLQSLLAMSTNSVSTWIVGCVFTKDDNSYVEEMGLSLLDWTHPLDT